MPASWAALFVDMLGSVQAELIKAVEDGSPMRE